MKRTLIIVIDALTARVVCPAMEGGQLPWMQQLAQRGTLRNECVSVFPSITPAATASIVTGEYPASHGISGAYFYDPDHDRVRYFGADFWAVIRDSFSTYFEDFLVHLNQEALMAETIFQAAERGGRRAGCINYMIFRGDKPHDVDLPWLMKLWPGVEFSPSINGPDLLYAGDFVTDRPKADADELSGPGGMFRRFGFNDDNTGEVLLSLAKSDAWPDLTLAYFPDNDFDSHSHGPTSALPTVKNVDDYLGQLIEASGGLDSFLERHAVFILGDHAQSNLVADQDARGIDLTRLLQGYDLVDAGAEWTDDNQLMACPNMRAAQIYLRRGYEDDQGKIVDQLLSDTRVDQLIWREPATTDRKDTVYHVATRDRGRLSFASAGDGHATHEGRVATDAFENRWVCNGDLQCVGAELVEGHLRYTEYPNALERIATAFNGTTSGDLWATARPGFEFKLDATEVHSAGSHGSLHRLDSHTALIACGLPESVEIPDPIRTIDVFSICAKVLEL